MNKNHRKMKALSFLPILLAAALQAWAQDEPQSTELAEVTVEASRVIHKSDMEVYIPSASAVANAANSLQLLFNLRIPAVQVNDVLSSVKFGGQDIQLRINGRTASASQLNAVSPESVKRVEWIENPGLRYNGAPAVLNLIVTNPTLGGSVMASAMPALNSAWGYYMADVKLNSGRSQWEALANFKLTENIGSHRDYSETFTRSDGSSLTRTESPLSGHFDNSFGDARLSYNYVKPDTTMLYVSLGASRNFSDSFYYRGLLSLSDGSPDITVCDSHGNPGTTPSLSAYFEHHLPHSQIIVADFNASLFSGRSSNDHSESIPSGILSDIHTSISDRNAAYALEADYIKHWRMARLTAGASYTANRNRSVYNNLPGETFHQRQDRAYLFTEYNHRIGNVSLTGGLGAQFISFMAAESGQGESSWHLRPQVSASWNLPRNSQLRLDFTSWQTAPSLVETNPVEQQIDGFQWQMGNPLLHTSRSYKLTAQYSFSLPRVSGVLAVCGYSSPDAVTPFMQWDADRLVTSFENSRGLRNLCLWLAPEIVIVPRHLAIGGIIRYRAEQMKGQDYTHYNHDLSGEIDLMASYKGWMFMATYIRAERTLWGEKIIWGESTSIISLAYSLRNWRFTAGVLNPFGKYDQGSKSLNRWNTNESHMRLDMCMPFLRVNYNLNWGHQKHSSGKLISVDATPAQSSAASR